MLIIEVIFSAALVLLVLPNMVVIPDSYSTSGSAKIQRVYISPSSDFGTPSEAMSRNLRLFNESLSNTGFVIIHLDHDPSDIRTAASNFFEASESDKMRYNFGPYGNPKGGYTPVGVEDVGSTSGSETGKDWVENYVFRVHPDNDAADTNHPKELVEAGRVYFEQMEALLKVLLKMAAASFDLEEVGRGGGEDRCDELTTNRLRVGTKP